MSAYNSAKGYQTREGVAMMFINRYYDYKVYSELGILSSLDDLDVFDAEAFGIIYSQIIKVKNEAK